MTEIREPIEIGPTTAGVLAGSSVERMTFLEMIAKYKFRVPDYQRQYAWTDHQINDLIKDMLSIRLEEGRGRFLGYITVTQQMQNDDERVLLLIDGQQRVTTLMLLLIYYAHISAHYAYPIADHFLARNPEDLSSYRFLPSQEPVQPDRIDLVKSYKALVSSLFSRSGHAVSQGTQQTSGSAAILNAYDTLRHAIEHSGISAEELLERIQALSVVLHVVRDEAAGAEIFDGVNNRGLGLSEVEKLKASILYYYDRILGNRGIQPRIDKTNEAFKIIYKLLKYHGIRRPSEIHLVDALLPACADIADSAELITSIARQKGVAAFRSLISSLPDERRIEFIDEYVERLPELVGYYCELVAARDDSYAGQGQLQNSMIQLSRGMTFLRRSAVSAPIVVAARFNNRVTDRDLIHLLRFLERVAVHTVVLLGSQARKGAAEFRKAAIDFSLNPDGARELVKELAETLYETILVGAKYKSTMKHLELHDSRGMGAYVHANWLASLGYSVRMSHLKEVNENRESPYLVKPAKQNKYGNRKKEDQDLERYAEHVINYWPICNDDKVMVSLKTMTIPERFLAIHEKARDVQPGLFKLNSNSDPGNRMERILKMFTDFAQNRWELDDPEALWNTSKYPLKYEIDFTENLDDDENIDGD